jgi:hypothetical protein
VPKQAKSPPLSFGTGVLLWALGAIMGGAAVSAYHDLRPQAAEQAPKPKPISAPETDDASPPPEPESEAPSEPPPDSKP